MQTDFRGVTTNSKSIICYGDFGIITYTLDYGNTFGQVNIGDKYSIKNIKTIGSTFIGATQNSLIKSTTNGLTWMNKEVFNSPEIIDAVVHNTMIYLLTSKGVYVADSNLTMLSVPIMVLDSTAEYSEIETDDTEIYIIYNRTKVIHYSLVTKQSDTTDVLDATAKSCGNCIGIAELKLLGNTLYCMVYEKEEYLRYLNYKKLVKSDNKGKNWKSLTGHIFYHGCYKVDTNNLIYGFLPEFITISQTSLLGVKYIQIDSSHYAADTSDYQIINEDKDSAYRAVRASTIPSDFTEVINVTKDTLVAVGFNNIIIMSYNGGKTWEIKSVFKAVFRGKEYASFQSKDRGYILNSLSYSKTSNGGITWLPQKFSDYPNLASKAPNSFYFNSLGRGYVKTITANRADTNILTTSDFGETYSLHRNDSLTHYRYDNNSSFAMKFPQGLDVGDYILNVIIRYRRDTNNTLIYTYILLRYDKNYSLVDTVILPCNYVLNMTVTKDTSIICLAFNSTGINRTDTAGFMKDYSYSYFVLKSTDKGKSWDSIKINIPIYQQLLKRYDSTYYYSQGVYSDCGFLKDNYILYPSSTPSRSRAGYTLMYRFDYIHNIFDTLEIPIVLSSVPKTMFSLGKTVYAVSSTNNLFYTKDIEARTPVWDSIQGSDIFSDWDNFDPRYPANGRDAILSAHTVNDTSGFLFIGKYSSDRDEFKLNVVKLRPNSSPLAVEEPKVEDPRVSLWNYQPYPVPGTTKINCKIYWNKAYNIDDAEIKVHTIYGALLPSQIQVNKLQDNLGIVEWDCSDAPTGVYIIQITLAGESRSFPVMVIK